GRALASARVAAVGPATADALRRSFIDPDIVPETFTTDALADAVKHAADLSGKKALLARSDIAEEDLAEQLRAAGADVADVAFYRTVRPDCLPQEALAAIRQRRADWVAFTSSSSVGNFLALLGRDAADLLGGVKLAAIGPVTAEALRSRGLAPAAVAAEHTIDGLVGAIVQNARPRE
ncbi:unnamed protein product, partial [marine sediment metagenome]